MQEKLFFFNEQSGLNINDYSFSKEEPELVNEISRYK